MHKIMERPIAVNGAVVVRPMMYLALSYDHRAHRWQRSRHISNQSEGRNRESENSADRFLICYCMSSEVETSLAHSLAVRDSSTSVGMTK